MHPEDTNQKWVSELLLLRVSVVQAHALRKRLVLHRKLCLFGLGRWLCPSVCILFVSRGIRTKGTVWLAMTTSSFVCSSVLVLVGHHVLIVIIDILIVFIAWHSLFYTTIWRPLISPSLIHFFIPFSTISVGSFAPLTLTTIVTVVISSLTVITLSMTISR